MESLRDSLCHKLGEPNLQLQPLVHGANARVFLFAGKFGEGVLKKYPDDGRQRREREVAACRFLHPRGEPVPETLWQDEELNLALFSRLEGWPLAGAALTAELVEESGAFLDRLHGYRGAGADLLPAEEACLSRGAVLALLRSRRARFSGHADSALNYFLENRFDPLCAQLMEAFQERTEALPEELGAEELTLSPSDFGLHNMLRTADKRLWFLDFEFFGRDDPAKLLADIYWHPALSWTCDLWSLFLRQRLAVYPAATTERLAQTRWLHGLKWVLLLLNEFLDDHWQRRAAAGRGGKRLLRQAQQLKKAQQLLERIEWESRDAL